MHIVVTGALGHIGSRLIRELPSFVRDAEITMIDDMSAQRYCSLFNLPEQGRYRFVEADVAKTPLAKLCKKPDLVIHLAAITNAAGSFDSKDAVEQNNFLGTKNVAEACVATGARMLYLSSTSVYGTQAEVVDEDCSAEELQPQSPYAETKLKEERFLQEMGRKQDLKFLICRFGTIFGVSPGMRFHTAVNKFCWQAITGQPLTVWRTALDQKRPYLDLGDAMQAFRLIIEKDIFDRNIYNVLTANLTVRDIVDAIKRDVKDVQINLVDTRIMNQLSYEVLNNKFKAKGFQAKGDVNASVSETLKWLKGAASAPRHGV